MVRFTGLKIQGIRSVGQEPHVINFLDPLTLIQGENGTGKTTLIEALNYVTTGALPAGKMQAFIHNNLVAQKTRVDALVQLEFENIFGQKCSVTKRMNSSIKGGKTTTKSDDFTLSITDKNGKEYSISSKVADFNREILKHLGVSKAVLENVIFCHQEESCWPLGEPKDLKKKFDEIFEVAKYVKAMENFKKLGKEYETSIKILDTELPYLMNNRSDFIKINCELNKYKNIKEELFLSINSVESENKQLQNNLITVREKREAIESSEKELIDLNARKIMLMKQIQSLPSVESYDGVKEKILEEIENLSKYNDHSNIEDIRNKITNDLKDIEVEIVKNKEHYEEMEKRMKNMDNNFKKLNNLKAEKDSICYRITTENNICVKSEENVIECFNSLKNLWTIESSNYKNSKKEILEKMRENYNVNQLKFVETKNLVSQISNSIVSKESELKNIEQNLQLLQDSQKRRDELTSQIDDKQKELDSINQEEIDKVFENKTLIENSIEVFSTLKNYISTKNSKNEEFEIQLYEHKEFFTEILGSQFIYGELYKNMKAKIVMCENEIKEQEKVKKYAITLLNELDKRNAVHSAIYNKYEEESVRCKKEIEKFFPDNNDIIETITITEQKIEKTKKKIGLIEGFKKVYESWFDELESCNACPLCKSTFQSKSHVAKFQENIINKINSSPGELEQLKKSLFADEIIFNNLIKANEFYKKYTNLQLYEIPKEQKVMKEINIEKSKHLMDIESIDNKIKILDEKLNSIKKYECETIKLDKIYEYCKELASKVEDAFNKACAVPLPADVSPLKLQEEYNIQIIEEKLLQLFNELEKSKNFISMISTKNQRKNELIREIQILTSKLLENFESIQKINLMKVRINELEKELENSKKEYRNLAVQLPKLEEKLTKNKIEMDDIEKELFEYESSLSKKIAKFSNDIEILENKENDIQELENILKSFSPDKLINEHNDVAEKIKYFEISKVDLEKQLMRLEREKDLLTTKQYQLNILNLKDELCELEKKITLNRYNKELKDRIIKEENNISNEIAKTTIEISSMGGELKETEKRLIELSRTLNDSKYYDADKIFKQKLIRKIVLKRAVRDLNLCFKVLDNSIIKFHEDKMEEINLTLSELWKKVYTGNDIESIKIKSKPINNIGDKRKSYDYAVVMVIDGNEIEMRDRCSAGQKMLASILIRTALCEVFCHQCPILALDEPTTNLDVNKVENIAEMLTDLVSYRMNGLPSKPRDDCCIEEKLMLEESWANSFRVKRNFSNFQLIVITHDIQLTHLLYRNFKPEYIYQLRKESNGTSRITSHKTIE